MSAAGIDPAWLATLRANISLRSLVERRVRLTRSGQLWKGCCPFHAEKTASFTLYPDNHYHCFGCGAHGDAIDFVVKTEGLSFWQAVKQLGVETNQNAAHGNRPRQRVGTECQTGKVAQQAADRDAAIRRSQRLVEESCLVADTPAARYLMEVRHIPEAALHLDDLGWHEPERALIVAMTDNVGQVKNCQRILLHPDGRNRLRPDGKKIKLFTRNAPTTGTALRLPGDADGPLLVAEGAETGLSGWSVTWHETWCALGTIGNLQRPADKRRPIIVLADDDPPEKAALLVRIVEQWRAEGYKVVVARPWPIPRGDKSDFNDLLREQGPEAVRARIRAATLELLGLASADPPRPLPTATLADASADLMRFAREAFRPVPKGQLAPQFLIGGQGGLGKTQIIGCLLPYVQLEAKRDGRPYRVIYLVPEHVKVGPEIAERFARLGLRVFRLEGRGDPFKPNPRRKPRCRNLPAVGAAIRAGAPVHEAVCEGTGGSRCPFHRACLDDGYLGDVRRAAEADVVIVAHDYLFTPLPKAVRHDVGWVVIDEDFTAKGDYIRNLHAQTFEADALSRFPVLHEAEPDEAATSWLKWAHAALLRAITRVSADGYLPAAALRAEGITPHNCVEARTLNWRRKVDVPMTPATDLAAREEMARAAPINRQLAVIAAIWQAAEAILCDGEGGAGRLSVAWVHDAKGSRREITVYSQDELAAWLTELEVPIIAIGMTTPIERVRQFLPRAVLRTPPHVVMPHACHRLILGGFGKATLNRRPNRLRQMRTYLAVENVGRTQGIVTHLSAIWAFAGMKDTQILYHGANAGADEMKEVDVHSVIGGMSASPRDIAALAAARSGRAVRPDRPELCTAAVLMTDGTGVAVPVFAYADPDAQAAHEAIYNGSIMQAATRPRQIRRTAANPCTINIFGYAAPDLPIDEVKHWRDVKPDRLYNMIEQSRVYENAAHMYALCREGEDRLFRTLRAAIDARRRMGDIRGRTREKVAPDVEPWVEVAYQPAGQGQRVSRGWCREYDAEAMRKALEAQFGGLVYWRVLPFTSGRREVVRKPDLAHESDSRTTSRHAGDLGHGFGP